MTWAIHAIASRSGNWMTTLCGIKGSSTIVATEWETDHGGKYTGGVVETAPMNDNRTVTCKRCLKAIEKARLQGDKLGMVRTI